MPPLSSRHPTKTCSCGTPYTVTGAHLNDKPVPPYWCPRCDQPPPAKTSK